jgi:hypothetical protein
LINIEVDNYYSQAYSDSINARDGSTEKFLVFSGLDAGAVIVIDNSVFRDSKFCKGLIVYRP